MPLSNTTKNLLDLYADLAEAKELKRHSTETLLKAITFAQSRSQWSVVATIAAEIGRRETAAMQNGATYS